MKIIIVNDAGKTETITCRKIEPATLAPGRIIIDEEKTISMADVVRIID